MAVHVGVTDEVRMRLRLQSAFVAFLALLALLILPWLAWGEAEREAYGSAAEVATGYARDVLYRADKTATQALEAIARLEAARLAACSTAELALMGQLDVSSSYIQAVGRVKDGVVTCLSVRELKLDLGADIFRAPSGVIMYLSVPIADRGTEPAIALQRGNFVVLIHRQLTLDTWTASRDIALGIFQVDRPTRDGPEVARGNVSRAWLRHLDGKDETTFIEGGRLIAVVHSNHFRIASVAALPPNDLIARRNAIAMRLVPAGVFAGLGACIAILSLAQRQRSLAAALRQAFRRKEFFVQYQPIVELATGRCVGVEALVRWRRSTGELIGPDLFIPAAEQSGLIARLTEQVLHIVQSDAGAWLRLNPDFHIAINLSPTDLHSLALVGLLDRFMQESGARPSNLVLEITERGLVDVDAARPILKALRTRGYNIAIDDFGTGYSSLSYLESLELNILKIDRSFVEAIGTRAPTSQVVGHIIAMARALGLQMVAEGVERQAQADYLNSHKVQYAQGWLFGRPVAFNLIIERMDAQQLVQEIPE